MESPHDFVALPWDHEPTSSPSWEGNRTDERLLPSWERSESPPNVGYLVWPRRASRTRSRITSAMCGSAPTAGVYQTSLPFLSVGLHQVGWPRLRRFRPTARGSPRVTGIVFWECRAAPSED